MLKLLGLVSLTIGPLLAWQAALSHADSLRHTERNLGIDKGGDIIGVVLCQAGLSYHCNIDGEAPVQWAWSISNCASSASGTATSTPSGLTIAVPSGTAGHILTITASNAYGSDVLHVSIQP